ncbi:lipoprotein signal peptidase [Flavobacterium amniphilum]|uniref:lipoprotein signal peptidase n=1 Tax=Flavobacterium amniphilum TaxID=1834035 RepID=UPI002029C6F0|nr:lipoprotein signal peptidase [Flavobacterium amniphilum]MCL9805969.1 lipoprotein signal peptidase [Flavobacterium amniphilum]
MNLKKAYFVVFLVLLIDQISKIYIKTHYVLHTGEDVFPWFQILFVENEGMAWGAEIPGAYGKIALTLFRIAAVTGIGYWLWLSVKEKASSLLIFSISLILAGAFGNILDSVFYGRIFNDSSYEVATMFSDKPYAPWFYGKVVDMFYFPIIKDYPMPDWVPLLGGKNFTFFNAIFNVADVAISTGVGLLIVFNKKAFAKKQL